MNNCTTFRQRCTIQAALDDAYTAYSQIETMIDELRQELESQYTRLDGGARKYGPYDLSALIVTIASLTIVRLSRPFPDLGLFLKALCKTLGR